MIPSTETGPGGNCWKYRRPCAFVQPAHYDVVGVATKTSMSWDSTLPGGSLLCCELIFIGKSDLHGNPIFSKGKLVFLFVGRVHLKLMRLKNACDRT